VIFLLRTKFRSVGDCQTQDGVVGQRESQHSDAILSTSRIFIPVIVHEGVSAHFTTSTLRHANFFKHDPTRTVFSGLAMFMIKLPIK